MGPRRLRRGNNRLAISPVDRGRRFNGAAPVKARKLHLLGVAEIAGEGLQWGRAG